MADGTFYVLTSANNAVVAATDSKPRAEFLQRVLPNTAIREATDLTHEEIVGPSPLWLAVRDWTKLGCTIDVTPFEYNRPIKLYCVLTNLDNGRETVIVQAPDQLKALWRSVKRFAEYDTAIGRTNIT